MFNLCRKSLEPKIRCLYIVIYFSSIVCVVWKWNSQERMSPKHPPYMYICIGARMQNRRIYVTQLKSRYLRIQQKEKGAVSASFVFFHLVAVSSSSSTFRIPWKEDGRFLPWSADSILRRVISPSYGCNVQKNIYARYNVRAKLVK